MRCAIYLRFRDGSDFLDSDSGHYVYYWLKRGDDHVFDRGFEKWEMYRGTLEKFCNFCKSQSISRYSILSSVAFMWFSGEKTALNVNQNGMYVYNSLVFLFFFSFFFFPFFSFCTICRTSMYHIGQAEVSGNFVIHTTVDGNVSFSMVIVYLL